MTPSDPIQAPGYGTDPNLVHPAPAPWPKTLTDPQLEAVAALADLLIPREGDLPAATEVGVVEVLDEWVSAPYPDQQVHRAMLLSGLDWCDRESERRFATPFAAAAEAEQLAIISDINNPDGAAELEGPRQFFAGLRTLVARRLLHQSGRRAASLAIRATSPSQASTLVLQQKRWRICRCSWRSWASSSDRP